MTSFAAKAPDGLRKYFVGLPVSGVLFISKFSQDCILDFFTLRIAEFGAMQRTANAKKFRFCSEFRPCRLLSLPVQHLSCVGSNELFYCHYSSYRLLAVHIPEQ